MQFNGASLLSLHGVDKVLKPCRPLSIVLRLARLSGLGTRAAGYCFSVPNDKIELDITFACDLKCDNCNRSCKQAPSNERMTTTQVERFVKQSIDGGFRWRQIRISGGEATLHPELADICRILDEYRRTFSPSAAIQVITNGFGKHVASVLPKLPRGVRVINTSKQGPSQNFVFFNAAPADHLMYMRTDYANGCAIPADCGTGLNRYGYYPCAVGGGVDRVMGFDIGLKAIPSTQTQVRKQLSALCRFCGHFRRYAEGREHTHTNKEIISPLWQKAYEEYSRSKPRLTVY
jgi:hypothetical protein